MIGNPSWIEMRTDPQCGSAMLKTRLRDCSLTRTGWEPLRADGADILAVCVGDES